MYEHASSRESDSRSHAAAENNRSPFDSRHHLQSVDQHHSEQNQGTSHDHGLSQHSEAIKSNWEKMTKAEEKNGHLPALSLHDQSFAGSSEHGRKQQIMHTLTHDYGLSPAGAAGVVGNMKQENGLSTATNSGGVGLCQWIGSRSREEHQFAHQQGLSPNSVKAQVGFMMHELHRDYQPLLKHLKTTNNPQSAALAFSKQYERPGKPQNHTRMRYAQEALQEFANT
jgi:hypothetical protein